MSENIITTTGLQFLELHGVKETTTPGYYVADVTQIDESASPSRVFVTVGPDDPYGLTPTIYAAVLDWIGASNPVSAHVPPTAEQVRAGMQPLSRVAFRTAFKNAGMTTAVIIAAIFSVEDESEQEDLQIAWEDSTEFRRLDPLVLLIADRAGKTPAQIDDIWNAAFTI